MSRVLRSATPWMLAVLLAIAVLLAVWTVRLESPVSLKHLESI